MLQGVKQVAVEGLLYSNFSLQSWYVRIEDSGKLDVLDWESEGHQAILTTNWQVLQFFGSGNFDHEADTRETALVLVLPRPEEGIAHSIFPEGALFHNKNNSYIELYPYK